MKIKTILLAIVVGFTTLLAQSNVSGSLPVTLEDSGTDCNGLGRLVTINADPSGLTGLGGAEAGIQGFVLVINASRNGVLTSVLPGSIPLGWHIELTQPPLTNQVIVAGWSTDMSAPNTNYHLVSLVLTGTQGHVTLSLATGTQVSTRLVTPGNGPSLFNLVLPAPLDTLIPANYNLDFYSGVELWGEIDSSYDLASPNGGALDVLDLVKLVICTP